MIRAIKDVKVLASTVDEWYGIEVTFKWATPFTYEEWIAAPGETSEKRPWAETREERDRMRRDDAEFVRQIAQELRDRPEWRAFYSREHEVTVDTNGSDPTPRRATIPQFRTMPEDWRFDQEGGQLSWSDR